MPDGLKRALYKVCVLRPASWRTDSPVGFSTAGTENGGASPMNARKASGTILASNL